MLTELKLANFRIFDDEVTVRFRPITVLIGRNSSGKSSIIKFLSMLRQSLGSSRSEFLEPSGNSEFLTPSGDVVNLGVFSDLKNKLTQKNNLFFELVSALPRQIVPGDRLAKFLLLPENTATNSLSYKVGATVPYDASMAALVEALGTLVPSEDAKASYSRTSGLGHTGFSLVDNSSDSTLLEFDTKISDRSTLLDLADDQLSDVPTYPSGPDSDKLSNELVMEGIKRLNETQAKQRLRDMLRAEINSIQHLLAVRDESQRLIPTSSPPPGYVGPRGQFALPHLQRMVADEHDGYTFLQPYFQSITGLEYVSFTSAGNTAIGFITWVSAKNGTTGADVPIADYGYGVSQCLPILVQGAIMPPHSTLMVEQPEAQLHPTAQLELGSFFADLWKQRQVASIIETHSDNILLRLRRLIARGDLPHEDVSVAYFTFDEDNGNMPIVKNLDINEDGSMQPGLPMEFFGADIIRRIEARSSRSDGYAPFAGMRSD